MVVGMSVSGRVLNVNVAARHGSQMGVVDALQFWAKFVMNNYLPLQLFTITTMGYSSPICSMLFSLSNVLSLHVHIRRHGRHTLQAEQVGRVTEWGSCHRLDGHRRGIRQETDWRA